MNKDENINKLVTCDEEEEINIDDIQILKKKLKNIYMVIFYSI